MHIIYVSYQTEVCGGQGLNGLVYDSFISHFLIVCINTLYQNVCHQFYQYSRYLECHAHAASGLQESNTNKMNRGWLSSASVAGPPPSLSVANDKEGRLQTEHTHHNYYIHLTLNLQPGVEGLLPRHKWGGRSVLYLWCPPPHN